MVSFNFMPYADATLPAYTMPSPRDSTLAMDTFAPPANRLATFVAWLASSPNVFKAETMTLTAFAVLVPPAAARSRPGFKTFCITSALS